MLDALGIRFGPAHTEVMLTATGPVLVESGARMHGSVPDEIVDRCTPSHQTLTAEAYLEPRSVARRAARPYELMAGAYCVMLISQHEGPDRRRRRHAGDRGAALLRRHDRRCSAPATS